LGEKLKNKGPTVPNIRSQFFGVANNGAIIVLKALPRRPLLFFFFLFSLAPAAIAYFLDGMASPTSPRRRLGIQKESGRLISPYRL